MKFLETVISLRMCASRMNFKPTRFPRLFPGKKFEFCIVIRVLKLSAWLKHAKVKDMKAKAKEGGVFRSMLEIAD